MSCSATSSSRHRLGVTGMAACFAGFATVIDSSGESFFGCRDGDATCDRPKDPMAALAGGGEGSTLRTGLASSVSATVLSPLPVVPKDPVVALAGCGDANTGVVG